MSRQINQPINQVRLTNVAVVRMTKGGKRFEIACYKNKVVDFRAGLELDLSEVLQTDRVFTNVSKGEFAKAKDLQKVFGTKDEEEISRLILAKGQLQVSDKERSQQLEKTTAQIADWISKNCVHPETDRPYTISQIKHSMQQANFSVHPTKPLKRQYLDCVKLLQNVIPIQRAKMELLVVVPLAYQEAIEDVMERNNVVVQQQKQQQQQSEADQTDSTTTTASVLKYNIKVDPSLYRVLNEALQNMESDNSRLEIINQVVTNQDDVDLETELQQNYNTMKTGSSAASPAPEPAASAPGMVSLNPQIETVAHQLQELEIGDSVSDSDGDRGTSAVAITDQHDLDNRGSVDVDEDQDDDVPITDRRKAQKAAKKKNKKAQRRTAAEAKINKQEQDEDPSNQFAGSSNTYGKDVSSSTQSVGSLQTINNNSSSSKNNNVNNSGERKSCNTCGGFFDSAAEFRSHFKSDWHRFNQKLKLKGCPPVSEKEFLLSDAESLFSIDTGGL